MFGQTQKQTKLLCSGSLPSNRKQNKDTVAES